MPKVKGSNTSSDEETLFQRLTKAEAVINDIETGRLSIRELQVVITFSNIFAII